jgi:hypothetical protein
MQKGYNGSSAHHDIIHTTQDCKRTYRGLTTLGTNTRAEDPCVRGVRAYSSESVNIGSASNKADVRPLAFAGGKATIIPLVAHLGNLLVEQMAGVKLQLLEVFGGGVRGLAQYKSSSIEV